MVLLAPSAPANAPIRDLTKGRTGARIALSELPKSRSKPFPEPAKLLKKPPRLHSPRTSRTAPRMNPAMRVPSAGAGADVAVEAAVVIAIKALPALPQTGRNRNRTHAITQNLPTNRRTSRSSSLQGMLHELPARHLPRPPCPSSCRVNRSQNTAALSRTNLQSPHRPIPQRPGPAARSSPQP